jgi:hypothetical protein
MRLVSSRIVAALAALTLIAATPRSYAGVEALLLVGSHTDAAGTQNGVGGGPLLELHAQLDRVAVHLEGIPVISIPGVKPSVAYGQATPALGIFNGQVEVLADRPGFLSVGLGETIYNQRTPLPAIGQTVASRLAGVRYTLRYVRPTRNNHVIEAFVGAAPVLTGADHYTFLDGSPETVKPEQASEIDAQLSLGYVRGSSEWLFGVRTLNFAARFTATGEGADRNVGFGPLIEWRHLFGSP